MRYHFSKQDDALYVRFNESKYAESDEVRDGVIFDYDKNGKIIGIEILEVSKRFPKKALQNLSRSRAPAPFA